MPEFERICEELKIDAHTIAQRAMEAWRRRARETPWLTAYEDLDLDHLPEVVRSLAEIAVCTRFDREQVRLGVDQGVKHGIDRRAQGAEESVIFQEYDVLRRTIWRRLEEQAENLRAPAESILRIDAALSLIIAASLRGFHRRELEEQGRWPEALDTLIREWRE